MKTNFADLPESELNRLGAIDIMGKHYYSEKSSGSIICKCGAYPEQYSHTETPHIKANWNPCSPDSNQVERYIFPRLIEKKLYITIHHERPSFFNMRIWDDLKASFERDYSHLISQQSTSDPDQINRTKLIAALEANEIINGETK